MRIKTYSLTQRKRLLEHTIKVMKEGKFTDEDLITKYQNQLNAVDDDLKTEQERINILKIGDVHLQTLKRRS